jgi:hypothetical protein
MEQYKTRFEKSEGRQIMYDFIVIIQHNMNWGKENGT